NMAPMARFADAAEPAIAMFSLVVISFDRFCLRKKAEPPPTRGANRCCEIAGTPRANFNAGPTLPQLSYQMPRGRAPHSKNIRTSGYASAFKFRPLESEAERSSRAGR